MKSLIVILLSLISTSLFSEGKGWHFSNELPGTGDGLVSRNDTVWSVSKSLEVYRLLRSTDFGKTWDEIFYYNTFQSPGKTL